CGSDGQFKDHTSCPSGKICREGGCKNADGTPIKPSPSPSPVVKDGDQIGQCFTGTDCKEGARSTLNACKLNKGYTDRNECLAAALKAAGPKTPTVSCWSGATCTTVTQKASAAECTASGGSTDKVVCLGKNLSAEGPKTPAVMCYDAGDCNKVTPKV